MTSAPDDEFPSERNRSLRFLLDRRTIIAALLCLGALGVPTFWWVRSTASGAEVRNGILKVVSEPGGATVLIDGRAVGTSPVSLPLPAGIHHLVVRQGDRSQELSVTITENSSITHHFSWSAEAPSATTGILQILADGARGLVTVDDVPRGPAPLTVNNLTAGDHHVALERNGTTYRRTIRIEPGATASLVFENSATAGPQSGWLAATAAIALQIFEDGKLVGSTASERILMPAGPHALEFVDTALAFRVSRTVNVVAGRTNIVGIELPQAPISINATPWANVWLDGRPLGETPIGNVLTTIGPHEIIFRHPQLGERRLTSLITMKEPARAAVDMRRPQ